MTTTARTAAAAPRGLAGAFAIAATIAIAACTPGAGAPPDGRAADEVEAVRARGHALFFGRAGCGACHAVGRDGDRIVGPNLGVGGDQAVPAARRQRGGRVGVPYLVESIVEPDAVVVPGYAAGVMPRLAAPPVALTDDELVALVVYLAAQGPGAAPVDAATLATARHEVAAARGR